MVERPGITFCDVVTSRRRMEHVHRDRARGRPACLEDPRRRGVVGAVLDHLDEAMRGHASHGLQLWDAMLSATAERAGCRLVLTENFQDGRSLERVLFADPFDAENARLLDRAFPSTNGASP
jgi:hypothetical protein